MERQLSFLFPKFRFHDDLRGRQFLRLGFPEYLVELEFLHAVQLLEAQVEFAQCSRKHADLGLVVGL